MTLHVTEVLSSRKPASSPPSSPYGSSSLSSPFRLRASQNCISQTVNSLSRLFFFTRLWHSAPISKLAPRTMTEPSPNFEIEHALEVLQSSDTPEAVLREAFLPNNGKLVAPDPLYSKLQDLPRNAIGIPNYADFCSAADRLAAGLPALGMKSSPSREPVLVCGTLFQFRDPNNPLSDSEVSHTSSFVSTDEEQSETRPGSLPPTAVRTSADADAAITATSLPAPVGRIEDSSDVSVDEDGSKDNIEDSVPTNVQFSVPFAAEGDSLKPSMDQATGQIDVNDVAPSEHASHKPQTPGPSSPDQDVIEKNRTSVPQADKEFSSPIVAKSILRPSSIAPPITVEPADNVTSGTGTGNDDENDRGLHYEYASTASPQSRRQSMRLSIASLSRQQYNDVSIQPEPLPMSDARMSTSLANSREPPTSTQRLSHRFGAFGFAVLDRTATGALHCDANGKCFSLFVEDVVKKGAGPIGFQCDQDDIANEMLDVFGQDSEARNGIQIEALGSTLSQGNIDAPSSKTVVNGDSERSNEIAVQSTSTGNVETNVLDDQDEMAVDPTVREQVHESLSAPTLTGYESASMFTRDATPSLSRARSARLSKIYSMSTDTDDITRSLIDVLPPVDDSGRKSRPDRSSSIPSHVMRQAGSNRVPLPITLGPDERPFNGAEEQAEAADTTHQEEANMSSAIQDVNQRTDQNPSNGAPVVDSMIDHEVPPSTRPQQGIPTEMGSKPGSVACDAGEAIEPVTEAIQNAMDNVPTSEETQQQPQEMAQNDVPPNAVHAIPKSLMINGMQQQAVIIPSQIFAQRASLICEACCPHIVSDLPNVQARLFTAHGVIPVTVGPLGVQQQQQQQQNQGNDPQAPPSHGTANLNLNQSVPNNSSASQVLSPEALPRQDGADIIKSVSDPARRATTTDRANVTGGGRKALSRNSLPAMKSSQGAQVERDEEEILDVSHRTSSTGYSNGSERISLEPVGTSHQRVARTPSLRLSSRRVSKAFDDDEPSVHTPDYAADIEQDDIEFDDEPSIGLAVQYHSFSKASPGSQVAGTSRQEPSPKNVRTPPPLHQTSNVCVETPLDKRHSDTTQEMRAAPLKSTSRVLAEVTNIPLDPLRDMEPRRSSAQSGMPKEIRKAVPLETTPAPPSVNLSQVPMIKFRERKLSTRVSISPKVKEWQMELLNRESAESARPSGCGAEATKARESEDYARVIPVKLSSSVNVHPSRQQSRASGQSRQCQDLRSSRQSRRLQEICTGNEHEATRKSRDMVTNSNSHSPELDHEVPPVPKSFDGKAVETDADGTEVIDLIDEPSIQVDTMDFSLIDPAPLAPRRSSCNETSQGIEQQAAAESERHLEKEVNDNPAPLAPRRSTANEKLHENQQQASAESERSVDKEGMGGKRSSVHNKPIGKRSSMKSQATCKRTSAETRAVGKRSSASSQPARKLASSNIQAVGKRSASLSQAVQKARSANTQADKTKISLDRQAGGKRSSANNEGTVRRRSTRNQTVQDDPDSGDDDNGEIEEDEVTDVDKNDAEDLAPSCEPDADDLNSMAFAPATEVVPETLEEFELENVGQVCKVSISPGMAGPLVTNSDREAPVVDSGTGEAVGAKKEVKKVSKKRKRKTATGGRGLQVTKKNRYTDLRPVSVRQERNGRRNTTAANTADEHETDGPVRRSRRQRFPVLKFWKNEMVTYERRTSQAIPTVSRVLIDVGETDSEFSMPPAHR